VIERNILPVLTAGQRELVFERRAECEALPGRALDHPLEEAPRARRPRRALERRHVAEQARRVRRGRKHRERRRGGREAALADRPERALGHELIEHVEGLHRNREPDAGLEVRGQEARVAGLPADHAVVAAIEEAHELDLGGAAFLDDTSQFAGVTRGLGARGGHRWTPSSRLQLRGVQPLKRSRRTFLSNLPTLVFGTTSMSTTSSGNAHFASLGRRKSRISPGSTVIPGLGTTQASGRSTHRGWGTAMTAASSTFGCPMIIVSTSIEEIHSPPDLMRSFGRAVLMTYPSGSLARTSPVLTHPSGGKRSVDSGLSQYELRPH